MRKRSSRSVPTPRPAQVRTVVLPVLDCGFGNVLPFTQRTCINGCTCRRSRSGIVLQTSDQPVVVNGSTVQPHAFRRVSPGDQVVIGSARGKLRLASVQILEESVTPK